jgi:TolB protein
MQRFLLAVAGLLLVGACTAGDDSGSSTTAAVTIPSSTESGPGVSSGRLVVIDQEGNVVTVSPDGSDQRAVTDDAGEAIRYAQPSWSPESDRIAWAEITAEGFGVGLSDPEGGERSVIPMNAPPFYLHWSPNGQSIGVLHNGPQGAIEFEFVDVEDLSTAVVASGSPFYFSWSPESEQVVVHVQGEIFGLIELDGTTTDLGATAVAYQSPHWTPSGIFHRGEQGLELRDVAGAAQVLATARGPLALVANQAGTRVAVQSIADDGPGGVTAATSETPMLPPNAVAVVDVATGEVTQITERPSIGFFWSPDGEKLLVLDPTGEAAEVNALVWDGEETTTLFNFVPHPALVGDVLQFFDQYSQSLRLWSPDSSAVVVVGAVEGEPGIWVHEIEGSGPVDVIDGSWAAWSQQ